MLRTPFFHSLQLQLPLLAGTLVFSKKKIELNKKKIELNTLLAGTLVFS